MKTLFITTIIVNIFAYLIKAFVDWDIFWILEIPKLSPFNRTGFLLILFAIQIFCLLAFLGGMKDFINEIKKELNK